MVTGGDCIKSPTVLKVLSGVSGLQEARDLVHQVADGLDMYRDARALCVEHGMASSVAQADYNIAWLYYLRGEYGRAEPAVPTPRPPRPERRHR